MISPALATTPRTAPLPLPASKPPAGFWRMTLSDVVAALLVGLAAGSIMAAWAAEPIEPISTETKAYAICGRDIPIDLPACDVTEMAR